MAATVAWPAGNHRRANVVAAASEASRGGKTCVSGMKRPQNWSAFKFDATLQKA
jgi:hypothetical protein